MCVGEDQVVVEYLFGGGTNCPDKCIKVRAIFTRAAVEMAPATGDDINTMIECSRRRHSDSPRLHSDIPIY